MRKCLVVAGLVLGCSSPNNASTTVAPTPEPVTSGGVATPVASATPSHGSVHDAPEISRSVGARGGVVIFWPRVSPRTDDPAVRAVAASVQQRLRQLAERALPGRQVDVRPEPERVCPRSGCDAMTLGASVAHTPRGGCLVVALVSGSGMSTQRLVPWAGEATIRQEVVPFREPPESSISGTDLSRCSDIEASLAARDEAVIAAIRAAAPPF